jgi:hypothetical protein
VKSNLWVSIMNFIVILFMVLLLFTLAALPFIVDKYLGIAGSQIQNTLLLKIFLYMSAVPFMVLLVMIKKLVNNIFKKIPFSRSSILALNVISICAFVDFLLYAIGTIIIIKNLLSLILTIAAFMVGLTSLILSQLVRYAMELKQENDLTI